MSGARLALGLAVAGMLGGALLGDSKGSDPHELWARGDCASCHDEAPRHHLEQRWELVHGRAEEGRACASCHDGSSCTGCHGRPPSSHDSAFRSPGDGDGRHALLGRLGPSACGACHKRFASDCAPCHLLAELEPWQERADEVLEPWRSLLEESP